METHPPKLIERFVGLLIPEACREHVMGDLHELFKSPAQYLWEALTTLPFILASQLRRTFRIESFFAQASALYIALGGASLTAGAAHLYDRGLVIPLAAVIAVVTLVLTLIDLYEVSERRSTSTTLFKIGLALGTGFASNFVLGLIHPAWTLPFWIMVAGMTVSIPLLYLLRRGPRQTLDDAPIDSGAAASFEELQQRSTKEYEIARRVKWAWLIGAVAGLFTNPYIRLESVLWVFGPSAVLMVGICFKFRQRQHRAENFHRQQLERMRDDLLFWAGSPMTGLLPGVGPAMILLLLAYPLFLLLFGLGHLPFPANINPAQVVAALAVSALPLVLWLAVRDASLRAARAIREELNALDRSKENDQ